MRCKWCRGWFFSERAFATHDCIKTFYVREVATVDADPYRYKTIEAKTAEDAAVKYVQRIGYEALNEYEYALQVAPPDDEGEFNHYFAMTVRAEPVMRTWVDESEEVTVIEPPPDDEESEVA